MNYEYLKTNIADVIKTNGNQEITGQLMQDALFALIENLGEGWQFGGVVHASDSPELWEDVRAFYLAAEKGTYVNFGGVEVTEFSVIVYDEEYGVLSLGVPFGSDTEGEIAALAERVSALEGKFPIKTGDIADAAVTTDKIANGAIISDKIGDDSVTTAKIADSAVQAAKLAPDSVTTDKIADKAITHNKIAYEAVGGDKIADGAVTTDKIADGVVIEDKIANGAITESKIADAAVTASKIGTGAVTNDKIGAGAVTTGKIADAAVTAAKLADESVTTDKIGAGAVTEEKIAPDYIAKVDASIDAKLDKAAFAPVLEAIAISSDNTDTSKAANTTAIAAYITRLKNLGVDVTSGFAAIPIMLDGEYAGYIQQVNASANWYAGVLKGGSQISILNGEVTVKDLCYNEPSGLTTTAQTVAGAINELDGKAGDAKDLNKRLQTLLGYNATRTVVNLEVGESGKYVQCASRSAAANAAFAISKPFSVDACSELLIKTGFNPSDDTHKALDITVIAIYEEIERQRTVQKTNDSGELLYYVVTVDEETGTKTVTQEETTENTGYPVYTVETYTETRYLPNNEDRFVSIPDSGYYVANLPQTCKVVISYKPGVSDTAVIIEKHGALANLISQVFGIYEHRTMVECMVSLEERIKSLEDGRGLLGNAAAGTVDVKELTKCLYPVDLYGHGVPAEANVPVNLPEGLPWDGIPAFKGQHYINLDAASGGFYYAVGTDSVNDWKQA